MWRSNSKFATRRTAMAWKPRTAPAGGPWYASRSVRPNAVAPLLGYLDPIIPVNRVPAWYRWRKDRMAHPGVSRANDDLPDPPRLWTADEANARVAELE